jgi:hypothetical protein
VGYASASNLKVHFGLGEDALATEIEVRWPSGKIQKLEKIAADQILELVEPTS